MTAEMAPAVAPATEPLDGVGSKPVNSGPKEAIGVSAPSVVAADNDANTEKDDPSMLWLVIFVIVLEPPTASVGLDIGTSTDSGNL